MDVRIYDVTGQTLARATLVKGDDGKVPSIAAVVRLMRKGKVFLAPWEEPKTTTTPKNDPDAESRAAAEKAQADRITAEKAAADKASADKRAAAEKAAAEKGGRQGGR